MRRHRTRPLLALTIAALLGNARLSADGGRKGEPVMNRLPQIINTRRSHFPWVNGGLPLRMLLSLGILPSFEERLLAATLISLDEQHPAALFELKSDKLLVRITEAEAVIRQRQAGLLRGHRPAVDELEAIVKSTASPETTAGDRADGHLMQGVHFCLLCTSVFRVDTSLSNMATNPKLARQRQHTR